MVRSGQTITILIPGPTNVSDRVVLSPQHKYLLKLSLLNEDVEKYKGTGSGQELTFWHTLGQKGQEIK